MYKQIIIARKDLNMSSGKLAAQVSHASMAFLLTKIRDTAEYQAEDSIHREGYYSEIFIDKNVYDNWINREYTKIVLQAKNKVQLYKAIKIAEEIGMIEGLDYFIIRDNCHTELKPEEDGKTVTCVGFAPMDDELINQIGRKFHMYM